MKSQFLPRSIHDTIIHYVFVDVQTRTAHTALGLAEVLYKHLKKYLIVLF